MFELNCSCITDTIDRSRHCYQLSRTKCNTHVMKNDPYFYFNLHQNKSRVVLCCSEFSKPCTVLTIICYHSQGIYDIHIKWKGRHIPKSPFRVKVASDLDSSKCYAEGPGLQSGIVEQQWTNFTVYTKGELISCPSTVLKKYNTIFSRMFTKLFAHKHQNLPRSERVQENLLV